jgi:vitamin B12 transporter
MSLSACIAAAVLPGIASAQRGQDTVHLDPIVVTATKLPAPASSTGAAVTVITGEQLRERGLRRVIDALRSVPGVAVAQLGGTGAVASVFMRGGESDYVQVVVDGVQVNDPGGSYDWAHLTTDDVERIEVVRGPVSVLYGSDAVAGVVQIFTRGGSRRSTASLQALGGRGLRAGPGADGSYDASDVNASITTGTRLGSGTDVTFGITGSQLNSDGGYAFNNAYRNRTIGAKAEISNGTRAHAGFTIRSVDQTFHYPTSGSGILVDHNQLTDGTSLALGLNGGVRIAPKIEALAQLTSYRSETGGENPADNPGDGFSNSSADVGRTAGEARVNAYLPMSSVLTGGVELEHQKGESTFDSDGPFGPFSSASTSERDNRALFAQLITAPLSKLTLSGGVRLDDNEQFGDFVTGRASASYRAMEGFTVRAAVGSGFKEPTFFEAFATGFAVGNPDLQPEHSSSVEGGIEIGRSSAHAGVTFFDQHFRDLIQYTFNAPTPTSPNYFNVGRARARGVELTAAASLLRDIGIEAEYTYVDSNVSDAGFGEDMAFVEGA